MFIWLAVLAETRTDKITHDVWSVNLVGHCCLDYHANIHALALACPGVDYIRLLPVPVQRPWQETPDPLPDPFPGSYAGTYDPAR